MHCGLDMMCHPRLGNIRYLEVAGVLLVVVRVVARMPVDVDLAVLGHLAVLSLSTDHHHSPIVVNGSRVT